MVLGQRMPRGSKLDAEMEEGVTDRLEKMEEGAKEAGEKQGGT